MHCFIAGVRWAAENFYLPAGPLQQRIINEDLTIHTGKTIGGGTFSIVFPCSYSGNPCVVKVLNSHATQLLSSLLASQMVQIEVLQGFQDEFDTSSESPQVHASCNNPNSNLPLLVMDDNL